ncbi:MAG: hypothetical protein JJ891_17500 [Rhizobiaceae bacterium]|nr:hypothetical protein [Rhizobiaceae bacterium]
MSYATFEQSPSWAIPSTTTTGTRHHQNMAARVENLARSETYAQNPEPLISRKLAGRLIIACILLSAFAGILYVSANMFGDRISRGGHAVESNLLNIRIGQNDLQVPNNSIRFPYQRTNGFTSKLDLYLHWPSLSGYTDALKEEFNQESGRSDIVFLTLEERSMRFDMAGRIKPIYSRFFSGKKENLQHGLVRQPLDQEAGFIDEDLYYSANQQRPFAARCVRDNAEIATPFCISDIQVGKNLMLTYRFHKKFLPKWLEMDQALRAYTNELAHTQ